MRTALALLALTFSPVLALAADAPAPDRPKSPAATAAITRAQKDEAAAAESYRANLLGIKRAELQELKAAQAAAIKGGTAGLDEANRIGAEVKRVQAEAEALKGGSAVGPVAGVELVQAEYGAKGQFADVTAAARARLKDGKGEIPADAVTLGLKANYLYGERKELRVRLRAGGATFTVMAIDGGKVSVGE